ncbi:beta-ketoacyl synthase N-terminal-like domain-containing protein [Bdellovibrio sp. GT3]|uniref:beta-ketoacyl synthase N-terminal-like domain-containing protein n=1 Tax=Bdellovibrio sp. GT3 TaxID=3136282 RepID=UPI0030F31AF9
MYIQNYSCITAAGAGTPAMMTALYGGVDCSTAGESGGRICYLNKDPRKLHSYTEIFVNAFKELIFPLREGLSKEAYTDLTKGRVVLIFASNKGALEDYIWKATPETIRELPDPYFEILKYFQENAVELEWVFDCSIGNASISSHAALEYAQDLFASKRAEYALIVSGDLIGPFVEKGYQSLNLLTHSKCRPFSENADGLQLGEAMGMVLLSRERKSAEDIKLLGVITKTQGSSTFPPVLDSQALLETLKDLNTSSPLHPDLILAHGSGTKPSDSAEDRALTEFLDFIKDSDVPITSTKWCIGNTEGACGLMDLIAACEILKTQKVFKIHNTSKKDDSLKGRYLLSSDAMSTDTKIRQILMTTLAFTGIYAACAVGIEENDHENSN